MIAEPVRPHDCSLVTDGAAGLVIVGPRHAAAKKGRAVRIAGIGHANERIAISKRVNIYEKTHR